MLLRTLNKLLSSYSRKCIGGAYSTATANIPKEEKVTVGDCNINYVKVGSGSHNVLCVPGALGTIWTDFRPQVEGFDRERFTLVAYDPPGYGKSRPPERNFKTNFYDSEAEWAYQFMKSLGIEKYSLLGWSDGGIASMILAAKHPEVVQKLVVWGANALILPHELEIYKKIKDIKTWSQRMRDPMIEVYGEELFAKYWAAWVDGMAYLYNQNDGNLCSQLLKDIRSPTLILHGEKDPMVDNSHVSHLHTNITGSIMEKLEELFAKYWAAWVDGMVYLYNQQDGNLCSQLLSDIRSPTLILHGEKDPMVDNSHVAHLHTNITGSIVKLYPKGKHNIHLAFAEDFNKTVQEFLLKK